jgi:hypothetical protein
MARTKYVVANGIARLLAISSDESNPAQVVGAGRVALEMLVDTSRRRQSIWDGLNTGSRVSFRSRKGARYTRPGHEGFVSRTSER